jgi:predicted transcriptional regulator
MTGANNQKYCMLDDNRLSGGQRVPTTVPVDPRLVAKIVGGYVARNPISISDLAHLISTVHQAMSGLGKTEPATEPRPPAVPVRRSVQRDVVICLECGWSGKMLRRHLNARHSLSPEVYRRAWKLAADHPLTAPSYSEQRSTVARAMGLGGHGRVTKAHAPPTPPRGGRPRKEAPPQA